MRDSRVPSVPWLPSADSLALPCLPVLFLSVLLLQPCVPATGEESPTSPPGSEVQRDSGSAFLTRGVVLVPEDLSLEDWPERARKAGLTTIALHHGGSPAAVADFIESPPGRDFLAKCARLGLAVEYELHAMRELLPRELFAREPEAFRMDEKGTRNPDANLCVHSPRALEIVTEKALALARRLRPTTGRYFLWGDDGLPWCRCPACGTFSDSDQALILENHLIRELRKAEPTASLAHLAYAGTIAAPTRVKPEPGIFLEFAPIQRAYDLPYEEQVGPERKDGLSLLEENLRVFPRDTAQVLEYWLDVSRFSNWRRPAVALAWRREVLAADARTYARLGIRHLTSFAAWVDLDYANRLGEPAFIQDYGDTLTGTAARSSAIPEAVARRDADFTLRIAALQVGQRHYERGNPGPEANFSVLAGEARKAAKEGPDLIVFPEYAISGWPYPSEARMNALAESVPGKGPWFARYQALARELGVPIAGWMLEASEGKLYNTAIVLESDGRLVGKYRKVHANLGEQTWWGWSQGRSLEPIELRGIRYGVSLCADMWFPETVRCEALLGADVILHLSIADDMRAILPARAFDNFVPIVISSFQGGSHAVDARGEALGSLPPEAPGWKIFSLRPFARHIDRKYEGLWDTRAGYFNVRNPSAYGALVDPARRPPWTEVFLDEERRPQTKEAILRRFGGRYDQGDGDGNR